jgi:hypothetical protein
MLPMNRLARFLVGDIDAFPAKRFAKLLIGGYALLFGGTLLVFVAPTLFARMLITPLWVFSIFVVLGTFAYAGIYFASMLRRWFRALRKNHPPGTT